MMPGIRTTGPTLSHIFQIKTDILALKYILNNKYLCKILTVGVKYFGSLEKNA